MGKGEIKVRDVDTAWRVIAGRFLHISDQIAEKDGGGRNCIKMGHCSARFCGGYALGFCIAKAASGSEYICKG